MAKVYFTIAGTRHYHGSAFMEPGMKVKLIKEPDNQYDREAIRVEMKGISKIGYVANSIHTVIGECHSAGRMYDRIGDVAYGKVVLVLPDGVICKLCKNKEEKERETDGSQNRNSEVKSKDIPEKVKVVMEEVADEFGCTVEELMSSDRRSEVAIPRQVVMYLAAKVTEASLFDIAKALSKKDHTTVTYGIRQVTRMMEKDQEFEKKIEVLKDRIQKKLL